MTEERQNQIAKDLLWDYTQGKAKIEAFRAAFVEMADKFDKTSKTLRFSPENLVGADLNVLQQEFATLLQSFREYKELRDKNAERFNSLMAMGVISKP